MFETENSTQNRKTKDFIDIASSHVFKYSISHMLTQHQTIQHRLNKKIQFIAEAYYKYSRFDRLSRSQMTSFSFEFRGGGQFSYQINIYSISVCAEICLNQQ